MSRRNTRAISGWTTRQLGHATIAQTSDTYGHLESERHEERVNLDEVLTPKRVPPRPNTSHPPPAEARPNSQLLRIIVGEMVVEGKGFVYLRTLSIRYFVGGTLQNAAN